MRSGLVRWSGGERTWGHSVQAGVLQALLAVAPRGAFSPRAAPTPGSGLGGGARGGPRSTPPIGSSNSLFPTSQPVGSAFAAAQMCSQAPGCNPQLSCRVRCAHEQVAALRGPQCPQLSPGDGSAAHRPGWLGCSGDDGAGSASASVTNVRLERGHMSEDDFGCLSRIWPHPSS